MVLFAAFSVALFIELRPPTEICRPEIVFPQAVGGPAVITKHVVCFAP